MEIYVVTKKHSRHQTDAGELIKAFYNILEATMFKESLIKKEKDDKIQYDVCTVELEEKSVKNKTTAIEYRECSYCKEKLTEGYVIFPDGSTEPDFRRLIFCDEECMLKGGFTIEEYERINEEHEGDSYYYDWNQ